MLGLQTRSSRLKKRSISQRVGDRSCQKAPAPFWRLAHEGHARGDLFRQVKGRIIPEVQDGDTVVAEDAADCEANEEDDADEGPLVEEFDVGAPWSSTQERLLAPLPVRPLEVLGLATILSTLEKVMPRRLMYGPGS